MEKKKFEEKLPISTERKRRNLVAMDKTIVKANKKHYYVYSAVDVKRNGLILMKVYTTRNYLTTRSFVKEVLKYCENKPIVIYKAPWLVEALESLGLEYEYEGVSRSVESVFSSFKQRVKIFFCSITAKKLDARICFCKPFMLL